MSAPNPTVPTSVLLSVVAKLWQIRGTVDCAKNNLFEVCSGLDEPNEPQQVYVCLSGLSEQFDALFKYIEEKEKEAIQVVLEGRAQ